MKFKVENKSFICFRQLDHHIYWKTPFTTRPLARIQSGFVTELVHKYSFIKYLFILCYDQQMHNYFKYYHTPTCFDTIVSSSGSLQSIPCQVTQVFQKQLLVIQFTIKTITSSLRMTRYCVETCRSVIICEIIVHLLVTVQNNKRPTVQVLNNTYFFIFFIFYRPFPSFIGGRKFGINICKISCYFPNIL